MVLELIFIGGVIYYYVGRHRKEKRAKLAATAAVRNGTPNSSHQPHPFPQHQQQQPYKDNLNGGYTNRPSYPSDVPPPVYQHGAARVVPQQQEDGHLPTYAESAAGGDEKQSPVVGVSPMREVKK